MRPSNAWKWVKKLTLPNRDSSFEYPQHMYCLRKSFGLGPTPLVHPRPSDVNPVWYVSNILLLCLHANFQPKILTTALLRNLNIWPFSFEYPQHMYCLRKSFGLGPTPLVHPRPSDVNPVWYVSNILLLCLHANFQQKILTTALLRNLNIWPLTP